MALAQTVVHSNHRPAIAGFVAPAPFGLPWLPAVILSEVMFILCRAGAQGFVSIDDIACWIVGLSPFALQLFGQRVFGWRSSRLIEVWVLSLAAYLVFQFADLAHFIEYPINLKIDVGVIRNITTSAAYVVLGLLPLMAFSALSGFGRTRSLLYVSAGAFTIPMLAFALFQPY